MKRAAKKQSIFFDENSIKLIEFSILVKIQLSEKHFVGRIPRMLFILLVIFFPKDTTTTQKGQQCSPLQNASWHGFTRVILCIVSVLTN